MLVRQRWRAGERQSGSHNPGPPRGAIPASPRGLKGPGRDPRPRAAHSGPLELSVAFSNSLSLQAQEILFNSYGERFRPRPLMKQMVKAGYNGKKAGRGWYRYGK